MKHEHESNKNKQLAKQLAGLPKNKPLVITKSGMIKPELEILFSKDSDDKVIARLIIR